MGDVESQKGLLTIFIPSYNRQESLRQALDSIFVAIDNSRYKELIRVLVVDDYSSDNIEQVISEQRRIGHSIDFHLQRQKCGVAEIAMFSCLEYIDTKYAWLLGNDDKIIPKAIDFLMEYLLEGTYSFMLLNFIGKCQDGSEYNYYTGSEKVLHFASGRDLFFNFGFVTATTTFPCLCFEVEPVKSLSFRYLTDISPIYSHVFAFFLAFYNSQCAFIPKPLVVFNHNERLDEQKKLRQSNFAHRNTAFYHATVGLVRHLTNVFQTFSFPLQELARYREDEMNKETKEVIPTLTGSFVFDSALAQLLFELSSQTFSSCHNRFR